MPFLHKNKGEHTPLLPLSGGEYTPLQKFTDGHTAYTHVYPPTTALIHMMLDEQSNVKVNHGRT
jgi:hypothetical protein